MDKLSPSSGCENGFNRKPRHCAEKPPPGTSLPSQYQAFKVRSVNCFAGPDWFGIRTKYCPLQLLAVEGRSPLGIARRQVADSE